MSGINPKSLPKHSLMSDTESSDNDSNGQKGWIDSFFELPSSNWFCKIQMGFITDDFNLYSLGMDKDHLKQAYLRLTQTENDSSDSFDSDSEDEIDECTGEMYGRLHARYLFTEEGTFEMYTKYLKGIFGTCPRFKCQKQKLLPIALSDKPGEQYVKVYCPKCKQIYQPDDLHSKLDGAYFTKSFAPYLLLVEPTLTDKVSLLDPSTSVWENSLFGQSESQSSQKTCKSPRITIPITQKL